MPGSLSACLQLDLMLQLHVLPGMKPVLHRFFCMRTGEPPDTSCMVLQGTRSPPPQTRRGATPTPSIGTSLAEGSGVHTMVYMAERSEGSLC